MRITIEDVIDMAPESRPEWLSLPLPSNDGEAPFFMIASKAESFAEEGRLGGSVRIVGDRACFHNPSSLLTAERMNTLAESLSAGKKDDAGNRTFGQALPEPQRFAGPRFDALGYSGPGYDGTKSLGDVIEMRGRRAFFEDVEPSDFSEFPCGMERIGMASLWFQSTWTNGISDRAEWQEGIANSVEVGDLLLVGPLSQEDDPRLGERGGENWDEVGDLGFGFFDWEGRLLPFTPYHDYDQDFFAEVLLTLDFDQALVCAVRETSCYGEDSETDDPDFGWRVYSRKVMVVRVTLSS